MLINKFVFLMHPELGGVCIPPGEVPEWAVPLITNQTAIVPDDLEDQVQDEDPEDPDDESDDESDDDLDAEEVPIPTKGGPGSSAKAWAKYAASKGFEVDGTATAAEIRESLEAEGIPTE